MKQWKQNQKNRNKYMKSIVNGSQRRKKLGKLKKMMIVLYSDCKVILKIYINSIL